MEELQKLQVPRWVKLVNRINIFLSQDLLGGPKVISMAWVINAHKFLTAFIVILLMVWFQNYSKAAYIYLALHGTYGFCWLLKHYAFRDQKWETKVTFGGALFLFLLLATYWIAPFLLISNLFIKHSAQLPNMVYTVSISLCLLGMTIMIASDCQKHFTLKYKSGLIKSGMYRYVRHPNYLGEMMIYASFALLVNHWLPWLVLAYWWSMIFLVNMLLIESSLSRFPEWKAYKAKTGILVPWIG
jgi:protein-S-isoprenylcysteine O-methyltransferase Ste14